MSAALPIAAAATTSALAAAVVAVAVVAVRRLERALDAVAGEPEPDEQITRTDHALALAVRVATAPAMHPDLVFLSPDGES